MNQGSRSYFEQRERVERAAAKRASCPQARRAHQELAQHYARLARHEPQHEPQHEPMRVEMNGRPTLSIVVPASN